MIDEDYKSEICADPHVRNNIRVSVTHNGHQWTSLSVNIDELVELRNSIDKFLGSEDARNTNIQTK